MITKELIQPRSIAVIGASNDTRKPGGKAIENLLAGAFPGPIYPVNPKETEVQGLSAYPSVAEIPSVDLAILSIPAAFCVETMRTLAESKGTRGFIVFSAGFGEVGEEGAKIESEMVEIADTYDAGLIGPNCIGVITPHYNGAFTLPLPTTDPAGCTLISGSGATAVMIMEVATTVGLRFSQVFSVGNSAQIGVEEVLQYIDQTEEGGAGEPGGGAGEPGGVAGETGGGAPRKDGASDGVAPRKDGASSGAAPTDRLGAASGVYGAAIGTPPPILLYIESITDPQKFLTHARSLRRKGYPIAAIKAGSSEAGERAAGSHTGALAGSDVAVDALFRKAGIIRVHSRRELTMLGAVLSQRALRGPRIAVVTHAGGPGVILTDTLSENGLAVPAITGDAAEELKGCLYPASSVGNPIDFLATGTAEQLATILDYCENRFDGIDGIAVIFGSPGLFPVDDAYRAIHEAIRKNKKPIYPILPSVVNAAKEAEEFRRNGNVAFPDEADAARAIAKAYHANEPYPDVSGDRSISNSDDATRLTLDINRLTPGPEGFLPPCEVAHLLDAVGIPRVPETTAHTADEAVSAAAALGYPIAMKAIGPVHKSDVGGVALGITGEDETRAAFPRIIAIPETTAVLLQPMVEGTELFAGVVFEPPYGHLIAVGLGGIFIEILKDAAYGLAPLGCEEAHAMIRSLKGYDLLRGARGRHGVDIEQLVAILGALSTLVGALPEITELDLNPIIATPHGIRAVDARIRVDRGDQIKGNEE